MKNLKLILAIGLFLGLGSALSAQAIYTHHKLTSSQFQQKYDQYKKKGFSIKQVDAYRFKGKIYYAALWQKDGSGRFSNHGMSAKGYQDMYAKRKKQGYRVIAIDGANNGGTGSYTAIWRKRKNGEQLKTHHGMSASTYQKKFDAYKKQGYRLTYVSAFSQGNQPRYNAIWEKKSGLYYKYITHPKMSSATYQAKVNQYSRQGYRLVLVSPFALGNTDYYAAIWHKKGGNRLSARHRMSEMGYINELDNHKYTGYALKQIAGYSRNGKRQFAAIWHSTNAWKGQDLAHIENKIYGFMRKHKVPGTSLALIKDGRLVYAKGFGEMEAGKGDAVGANSLFRVASVSKPMTATAIMKLRERQGNLLTQRVFGKNSILGNNYKGLNSAEKIINVQHLLEHTAGGNKWNNKSDGGMSDPMFQKSNLPHSKLIGWMIKDYNPSVVPGKTSDYSNFGYCILGRVIEKKSRKSYERYMKDNILRPMGIRNMHIGNNSKNGRRYNEVVYHDKDAYKWNVRRMDAHGGWIGSSVDLAKFLVHTDGKSNHRDIISKSSYNKMIEKSKATNSYAKGWSISGSNEWHGGSLPGTGAIIVQAGNGVSWVFLMNKRWTSEADGMLWEIVNGIKTWPRHDYLK